MIHFTEKDLFVDIITENYNLLPVINRFGLHPGFSDSSIEEICKSANIDIAFFLAVINTYNNDKYFPRDELINFSPLLIINYLKNTHKYYINYILPKLDNLLNCLIEKHKHSTTELHLLKLFYNKYKTELLHHINEEEEKTFPYILNLLNNKSNTKYNIHEFEEEHTNVDEKLNDLKLLILKHINIKLENETINEFLMTLFRFEKDINNHARIEDNILIPQTRNLEKKQNR